MKCDYCNKPPIANYQKLWMRWTILPNGNYADAPRYSAGARALNDNDEPVGEENVHVCTRHEKEFIRGEL